MNSRFDAGNLARVSTDRSSGIYSLNVGGNTLINSGGILGLGNIFDPVGANLGALIMDGGFLNLTGGDSADNGTTDGGTNLVTVARLEGNGTIRGNKTGATLTTTGSLVVNGSVNGTFSGVIENGLANNTVTLTKAGNSTLTLNGTSSYTGGTIINAGTLLVGGNSSLGGAAGSATVAGADEAILRFSEGITISNNVIFSSSNASSAVQAVIGGNASYSVGTAGNFSSDLAGGMDTTAVILDGTNSSLSAATLDMSFSTISAATNDELRGSDVFSLDGTTGDDVFTLQLTVVGLGSAAYLGWLDVDEWVTATEGNSGIPGTFAGFHALSYADFLNDNGPFDPITMLGAYGNDGGGGVWAVLNHNSDFAAIPEPGTSVLIGIGSAFMLWNLRRRRDV